MPELLPLESGYYVWEYVPSKVASIIAALLWITVFGLLTWRIVKTRTWFCLALVIGCFMEIMGYAARAAAADRTNSLMPFLLQSSYILLPPALFAATIYMCLGRIITLVGGEHLSLIRPSRLTKVFVGGDVLSFIIQGGSSGLTIMGTSKPAMATIGKAMVITGLFMQLISFGLFALTAVLFHMRIRKAPTTRSIQVDQTWIQTMSLLYGISILIIIRSIFRIAEFVMGNTGYLLSNEWPLYVFDTVPMFLVAALFFWRYPANIAQKKGVDLELASPYSAVNLTPSKSY